MKRLAIAVVFMTSLAVGAQTTSELQKHYEAFYKEMRLQGDVIGVINALTHLNVIAPTTARKDTLAYVYANTINTCRR